MNKNIEHRTSNAEHRSASARSFRRLTLRSATGTARRAVTTRHWAVFITAVLFIARVGWTQEKLDEFKWSDLRDKLPRGATLTQVDGREVLKIENTNDAPLQVNLLTIEHPKITTVVYELSGEVRYENVKGDGYLEMWNSFAAEKPGGPDEEAFSRTLGDSGPDGKISGTSDWRKFVLPFDSTGATTPPKQLRVNLILPGRGTVYVGLATLAQLPNAKSAYSSVYPNAWWSPPATGNIFGWGGAVIGCLGGLCGFLVSQGKARGFVLAALRFLTVLGVGMALGGFIALGMGQPFFVWAPMLFTALLLLAIIPVNLRQFRRRYEELELRRMASMDVSRV